MGVAVTTKHYQGGCLCGWIRFRAAAPADNPHACSCKNCQRHTGALSAVWLEFPRDRVEWTGPGGRARRVSFVGVFQPGLLRALRQLRRRD